MSQEQPRILIVDDAPINIQVLSEALQGECRTCFAINGADALSVARTVVPDLILLDVMMPGMDGYEVCRQLKADPVLQGIPVIFVTALTQQENETVGLELGAVDYIPKPCNPALVRLRVRNQLELKRQRDQLATMNARLEERVGERTAALEGALQELEQLCYAISHDLRAPLRHINAFSTIILDRCGGAFDEECAADFARIGAAANKMGLLVDALLNLPRLWRRSIVREAVNLSAMAQEIMDSLRRDDPQRSVEVQIAAPMTIQADRSLLRIALEQLLDNAWKFSAGSCPARIECGFEQLNGRDVYYVRDNGAGFDMAYAQKLFGIFQRLHQENEFAGIGMGLAIVQRIIASHGGEIWAEGAVGAGATFRFTVNTPISGIESTGGKRTT